MGRDILADETRWTETERDGQRHFGSGYETDRGVRDRHGQGHFDKGDEVDRDGQRRTDILAGKTRRTKMDGDEKRHFDMRWIETARDGQGYFGRRDKPDRDRLRQRWKEAGKTIERDKQRHFCRGDESDRDGQR